MERSKEFISKACKNTGVGGGGGGGGVVVSSDFADADEDMHMKGPFESWAEDA